MYAILTGSTGFVGKNLVPYLTEKNYDLEFLTRNDLQECNYSIPSNCDFMIHLAGKAHDLKNVSNPAEYYEVNFELTKQLYDVFLKSNAKKFIFISSVKANADSVSEILTEDNSSNPKTDYGKSKRMAEDYIKKQQLPKGKSYYILRPCMIHGPGNRGNLNLLYQFVQKRIPYPLASFENKRSFISIENVCFIINEILKQDIPTGIYNMADDEPMSTNEIVRLFSRVSGRKASLLRIPKNLIRFLSRIGDKFKLPLNTERLTKLTENYIVSNQKIKRAIQKELPLTACEGLLLTAKSFGTK